MYTLYKFHFLNGISEINQLFDDILIIWPAPVCIQLKSIIPYVLYINKLRSKRIEIWGYKELQL